MSATMLICDQAVFTSIRTPMGEGYRIVASTRGLSPEEKQVITRNSPSHDGLCAGPAGSGGGAMFAHATAFYPLPTGRLCVALSYLAGVEHTGRGGHRVYTHNVIFPRADFPACGYNPFNVLRGMITAGLDTPQLKPPAALPNLELDVVAAPLHSWPPPLDSACRCRLLEGLLHGQSFLVNLDGSWLESTEALLMGVPGPARADLSFDAGFKFSLGRIHRLHLLHDDTGAARARIAGQPIEYVDPKSAAPTASVKGAWISFVDRHWASGDVGTLARRTSRDFTDVGPVGRERLGRLYTLIDGVERTETPALLTAAEGELNQSKEGAGQEVAAEFLDVTRKILATRLGCAPWSEVAPQWRGLVGVWKRSTRTAAFAQPLLRQTLHTAMREDPVAAAGAALAIAEGIPAGADLRAHEALLDEVLESLADLTGQTAGFEVEPVLRLCDQWQARRPSCPILERVRRNCTAAASRS